MPALGTFVLHSMANPPLKAGDYTLTGQVTVEKADNSPVGAIDPQATNLRITAPRYRLPPDQLLSTFPPANAVGAFSARLPQAVIKRRTLPWEREPAPGAATTPWLALVVIAEGEGTLSGDVPIAECVTPGVTLTGPNDVATGTYLSVTRTVIDKVFPMQDELALLCHVREVDVADTELAAGDDDGFLAVVIANRLPQYDRAGDKPVRYMACLINLEGQLESLAKQQPKVFEYLTNAVVFDYRAAVPSAGDADHLVMGHAATVAAFNTVAVRGARGVARAARADAPGRDGEQATAKRATGPAAANKATGAQWATTTAKIETAGLTSAANEAGRLVRDGMREGYRGNLEHLGLAETVYRFPVLVSWSFTVGDDGGFDVLMQRLDVGLLGTEPAVPKLRPGAVPPPPPPPEPRPLPEFTETGHVGLPHLTRGGERVRAWYRGPLGTSPTERDVPDPSTTPPGRLPFAHVSDQLRRVVPDGREDLSLAAAFEIGRLLALSQPSLVRALLAWRGEQFGAARSRGLFHVMSDAPGLVKALKGGGADAGKADGAAGLLSRHLVTQAGARPAQVFATTRPVADPGRALPYAREGGLDKLIAEGFGFTTGQVQEFRKGAGSALSLQRVAVPLGKRATDAPLLEGAAIERLRGALGVDVDRLTADSIGQQVPGGVGGGAGGGIGVIGPQVGPRGRRRGAAPTAATPSAAAAEPDALDALIARATTARRSKP